MNNGEDGHQLAPKTFAEFFAGIGLVGEGLRAGGWDCVYANDVCPVKRRLFAQRNDSVEHYHLHDIRDTETIASRIEDRPTLATASFPCIDLSVAGHYRGLGGVHSSTFFAFADVLRTLGKRRPRCVLLENVRGFLTARSGRDFQVAVRELAKLGYWIDTLLVDARHFVPQSRPRVFVLGVDRPFGNASSESTLFGTAVRRPSVSDVRPRQLVELVAKTPLETGWCQAELPSLPLPMHNLLDALDTGDSAEWWSHDEVDRHRAMFSDRHRVRLTHLVETGATWVGTGFRRIRRGSQRLEVRFDGIAGCLRTPTGGSAKQIVVAVSDGHLRMRWMTPDEYARLQGTDISRMSGTRNQLLKAFADAVCVPAVEWIDTHVLTPLYDESMAVGSTGAGTVLAR